MSEKEPERDAPKDPCGFERTWDAAGQQVLVTCERQAEWVVATVTGRDPRRVCSGHLTARLRERPRPLVVLSVEDKHLAQLLVGGA